MELNSVASSQIECHTLYFSGTFGSLHSSCSSSKKCPFRSDRGGLYAIGAVTLVLGASTKLLPPPLARFPLPRRKVSHIHIDVNVRWDLRKMCSAKWNARSLVKKKSDLVFQIISSDEYQNIVHRFTFSSFEINRTAKRRQSLIWYNVRQFCNLNCIPIPNSEDDGVV